MTAPVSQEKRDNQWRVTFIMPAEYTLEMLPEPNDEDVKLKRRTRPVDGHGEVFGDLE